MKNFIKNLVKERRKSYTLIIDDGHLIHVTLVINEQSKRVHKYVVLTRRKNYPVTKLIVKTKLNERELTDSKVELTKQGYEVFTLANGYVRIRNRNEWI